MKTDMAMNICSRPYVDASSRTLTAPWLLLMSLRSVMKVESLLNNRGQLNGEIFIQSDRLTCIKKLP